MTELNVFEKQGKAMCIYLTEYHISLLVNAGMLSYGKNSQVSKWIREQIEEHFGRDQTLEETKGKLINDVNNLGCELEQKNKAISQIDKKIKLRELIKEKFAGYPEKEIKFFQELIRRKEEGSYNLLSAKKEYESTFGKKIDSQELVRLLS